MYLVLNAVAAAFYLFSTYLTMLLVEEEEYGQAFGIVCFQIGILVAIRAVIP